MSASPGSAPDAAHRLVVPVFATAAYLAGLVATWGLTSLILDRDVIDYPDAGLLLGPAMAVSACLVVFVASIRARRSPTPILYGALTALVALVVILAVGGIGYSIARSSFALLLDAVIHFAISPFMLCAALLAGIVVGGTAIVARRPMGPRPVPPAED